MDAGGTRGTGWSAQHSPTGIQLTTLPLGHPNLQFHRFHPTKHPPCRPTCRGEARQLQQQVQQAGIAFVHSCLPQLLHQRRICQQGVQGGAPLAQQPVAQQGGVTGFLVGVQRPGCVLQLPVLQEGSLDALQLGGGVATRCLLFRFLAAVIAALLALLCLLSLLSLPQLVLLQQQQQQGRTALALRGGPCPLRQAEGGGGVGVSCSLCKAPPASIDRSAAQEPSCTACPPLPPISTPTLGLLTHHAQQQLRQRLVLPLHRNVQQRAAGAVGQGVEHCGAPLCWDGSKHQLQQRLLVPANVDKKGNRCGVSNECVALCCAQPRHSQSAIRQSTP